MLPQYMALCVCFVCLVCMSNKNARRPKEAHNARILKEIKIVDRAGEDLKELDQH